jgi:hypothetical protein
VFCNVVGKFPNCLACACPARPVAQRPPPASYCRVDQRVAPRDPFPEVSSPPMCYGPVTVTARGAKRATRDQMPRTVYPYPAPQRNRFAPRPHLSQPTAAHPPRPASSPGPPRPARSGRSGGEDAGPRRPGRPGCQSVAAAGRSPLGSTVLEMPAAQASRPSGGFVPDKVQPGLGSHPVLRIERLPADIARVSYPRTGTIRAARRTGRVLRQCLSVIRAASRLGLDARQGAG